jgi:exonuclease VII small subunit
MSGHKPWSEIRREPTPPPVTDVEALRKEIAELGEIAYSEGLGSPERGLQFLTALAQRIETLERERDESERKWQIGMNATREFYEAKLAEAEARIETLERETALTRADTGNLGHALYGATVRAETAEAKLAEAERAKDAWRDRALPAEHKLAEAEAALERIRSRDHFELGYMQFVQHEVYAALRSLRGET